MTKTVLVWICNENNFKITCSNFAPYLQSNTASNIEYSWCNICRAESCFKMRLKYQNSNRFQAYSNLFPLITKMLASVSDYKLPHFARNSYKQYFCPDSLCYWNPLFKKKKKKKRIAYTFGGDFFIIQVFFEKTKKEKKHRRDLRERDKKKGCGLVILFKICQLLP